MVPRGGLRDNRPPPCDNSVRRPCVIIKRLRIGSLLLGQSVTTVIKSPVGKHFWWNGVKLEALLSI